jgi:tetratricopeptide (TPR) repeat protein
MPNRVAHFGAGVRAAFITLLAVLLMSVAPPARAADDQNLTIALKKFDAGRKAFEGGAFEEALIAFQESIALSPSPNSRLYIARCYRALGKVASAYTAFHLAAHEAQDRLTATKEKRSGRRATPRTTRSRSSSRRCRVSRSRCPRECPKASCSGRTARTCRRPRHGRRGPRTLESARLSGPLGAIASTKRLATIRLHFGQPWSPPFRNGRLAGVPMGGARDPRVWPEPLLRS